MMKIWGRASSSNVMKVLWLCEELGLPFERIDAGGAFGRTKEPFYLAMNPNGVVPTLEEENGFTLWESNVICRYLVNSRAPGNPLYPTEPRGRADAERWMDWQQTALNPPMVTLFFTHIRLKPEERDMAAHDKALASAGQLWAMVERQLGDKPFLNGGLTLADICVGVWVHRWFGLPLARPELPALAAYYARLKQRPGYAKHVALPLT
jgi:glutathione S-transferase